MVRYKASSMKDKLTPELARERDKDRQMVKGIFRNLEQQGMKLSFPYLKYPGDEVTMYNLECGQEATIPLGVAKHLNQNCWYPQHENLVDEDGKRVTSIRSKTHRFSFVPLEFGAMEEVAPPLKKGIVTTEGTSKKL